MRAHVDLVGLLYMVWGGLNLLLGTAWLMLGLGAAAMAGRPSPSGGLAAGVIAAAFLGIAVLALGWGAVHVWAGRALRRHSASARLLGLAMAVLDLVVLPFGTALAAYSLWVLLNDQSRELFEDRALGPA